MLGTPQGSHVALARFLLIAWLLGTESAFLTAAPVPNGQATPIPKETLEAWRNAGAGVTWGRRVKGVWHSLPDGDGSGDATPVFIFTKFDADARKLPKPDCRYGLWLVK